MRFTVGDIQRTGLDIYVLDPAVEADGDEFPGRLDGSTLHVDDPDRASALLTDAANSADEDGDRQVRDALTALARRVGKAEASRNSG